MADPKQITVQGVSGLEVSQPYAEGHKLTEAEAKALNQVRAENVGNNVRAAVKKLVDEAGGKDKIDDKLKAAVQKLVTERDEKYEFTLTNVGGGATKLTPVESEARKIARAYVNSQIAAKDMTVKAYREENGDDKYNGLIAQVAEAPNVVKAAEKAVADRQKLATDIAI